MSTLEVSNLNDGTTTVPTTYITNGSAKAWLQWLVASNSYADSFNISSGTDDGTGKFTHAFSSDMSNGNYVHSFSLTDNINQWWCQNHTTSQFQARTYTGSSYADDDQFIVIHGDLA